ncbi:TetR/AcrR family transcriptional regulator [Rhodococcus pyridinivorans]|uniref:TetR/AcrR family transcriptional regulator n=1 Tax=Rhodococcus pyridinivorans TaxID=103816 RepID=UPI001E2F3B45|nr:TetR/AcrR family transcriptional regulator [Rhodococcus pyridinivorans]MCD5422700.1 TetR/AcrR family transcriptional regulator [Rhodococcus pyridinivorans]
MSGTDRSISGGPARIRKRNAEKTKKAILSVAGRRFARSGYSHVSLQDIANEVGVTPAMINHHFGSKLALFDAVARDNWELDDAAAIRHVEDAAAFAREWIDYWNNNDRRSPSLALARSLDLSDAVELFRLEYERRLLEPVRGRLHGPDIEMRARIIAGLFMGFGYFTTGALMDPDAPPLSVEETAIAGDYLERVIDVLLGEK